MKKYQPPFTNEISRMITEVSDQKSILKRDRKIFDLTHQGRIFASERGYWEVRDGEV